MIYLDCVRFEADCSEPSAFDAASVRSDGEAAATAAAAAAATTKTRHHLAHVVCWSGVNAESKPERATVTADGGGGCGDLATTMAAAESSSASASSAPPQPSLPMPPPLRNGLCGVVAATDGVDRLPMIESMLNPVDGCLTANRPLPATLVIGYCWMGGGGAGACLYDAAAAAAAAAATCPLCSRFKPNVMRASSAAGNCNDGGGGGGCEATRPPDWGGGGGPGCWLGGGR